MQSRELAENKAIVEKLGNRNEENLLASMSLKGNQSTGKDSSQNIYDEFHLAVLHNVFCLVLEIEAFIPRKQRGLGLESWRP